MSRGMWIIIILITIMMVSSYWFGRDREAPPWAKCKESLFEQVVFKNCTPSSLVRPQNQKIQLAEKLYKEILALNKDHVEANYQLGTLYSQLQNFNLAKSLLAKAHKLSPNNPNINLHIGNLLLSTGEPSEAINYFEKVIQKQPNFSLAHFNKGITLYNQKKYYDAVKCFEKVIEIEPNNINAYNVLGIIFQEIGEFQKSLSY